MKLNPTNPNTERDRKRLADLYFSAALAAWTGDVDAALAHARAAADLAASIFRVAPAGA